MNGKYIFERWARVSETAMKIHIGTNTKMYKTIAQTSEYLSELREQIQDIDSSLAEIFVIPLIQPWRVLRGLQKNKYSAGSPEYGLGG